MKRLIVAAVQATSENGAVERNLRNAASLVRDAVRQGARLVVCPEFLAAGYQYRESIWDCGEPRGGATESWLAGLAADHDIYIGATYLEAAGDQFYNTFALFGPGGQLLGRVRKGSLPAFEGWYFAPSAEPKVIDTDLGRLGIGICNDNQTAEFFRHMVDQAPDLLLMPHSAPTPQFPVLAGQFRRQYSSIAGFYARELGIPVVFANKVSARTIWTPVPILPLARVPFRCEGFSSIHLAGGHLVEQKARTETVVVGEVTLDPAHKRTPGLRPTSYWAHRGILSPTLSGRAFELLTVRGHRAYTTNPRRAAAAKSRTA
ncbi:carbon-nitrogen hydrolase family protein [Nocardia transvalensis]|uniref:carbon-nitrogen hydrolase family protein n=1 Tax=Nocardia transvalensis TaxID=37333 RepID=UPI0018938907|nr:carbon-nitrogen hydrolase family protein [Nocardia transvalensis]MBF6331443.1 carbon-nitrogen hydrolase family protein [Nocardia transvalensis]